MNILYNYYNCRTKKVLIRPVQMIYFKSYRRMTYMINIPIKHNASKYFYHKSLEIIYIFLKKKQFVIIN